MKKIYVIAPLVLCALFALVYINFAKEQKIKVAEKQRLVAEAKAAEDAKKKAAEEKARQDADERARKRAEDEAKKEAEKRAKWDAQSKEIADSTTKYNGEAEKFAKQSADLELQLAELRRRKESLNREAFDLQKKVELARIAKRNAELEIQRMTEMVTQRAAGSSLAKGPSVATTP